MEVIENIIDWMEDLVDNFAPEDCDSTCVTSRAFSWLLRHKIIVMLVIIAWSVFASFVITEKELSIATVLMTLLSIVLFTVIIIAIFIFLVYMEALAKNLTLLLFDPDRRIYDKASETGYLEIWMDDAFDGND